MHIPKTYKMKISQKRTCNRCKVATVGYYGSGTSVNICGLGYRTAVYDIYGNGWITEMKPMEPCPKPITNMLAIEARKYYYKSFDN